MHRDNPHFAFLFGGEGKAYYAQMLQRVRSDKATNFQSQSSNGSQRLQLDHLSAPSAPSLSPSLPTAASSSSLSSLPLPSSADLARTLMNRQQAMSDLVSHCERLRLELSSQQGGAQMIGDIQKMVQIMAKHGGRKCHHSTNYDLQTVCTPQCLGDIQQFSENWRWCLNDNRGCQARRQVRSTDQISSEGESALLVLVGGGWARPGALRTRIDPGPSAADRGSLINC